VGIIAILALLVPTIIVPSPTYQATTIYLANYVQNVAVPIPCNCSTTTVNAITTFAATTHDRTADRTAQIDGG
jgi:hypothetical protein